MAATLTDTGVVWYDVFHSLDVWSLILLLLVVGIAALFVDMLLQFRMARLMPADLLESVRKEMNQGGYENAAELCSKSPAMLGQVFAAALNKTDYTFDRMEDAMRAELKLQTAAWRQRFRMFLCAAIAGPLLSVLFALTHALPIVSQGAAAGLRTALYSIYLCLALGVLSALLAVCAWFCGTARLDTIMHESERLGQELLDPFRPLPDDAPMEA